MAGSLFWQTYQTDTGENFAIFMDKSNCLAVNASATAVPASLPADGVPRNIKPRYALFRSADGYTTRKVVVLTPADVTALTPGTTFVTNPGGVTVKLQTIIGEKRRLPQTADSGLTT